MEARGKTSCPDLMHAAVSVMDAVQNLANAAQEVVSESEDEVSCNFPEPFHMTMAGNVMWP